MPKPMTKIELQIELEKAKKREMELEKVIESLDISLCRWQPDTTLMYANGKYKKMFGIMGNVEGKKWLNFIPEEDRISTASFYSEVTKNPRVVTYEHPVTVEDGKVRHYQWFDTPILDVNGCVTEFQSIGIDITERKLSENELIANDKKLRSLIDSQSHYVIRVDMAGRYSYWNAQFEKEFGWLYEPQGIQNADVMIAVCKYHHQRVRDVVEKCFTQPGVVFVVEVDKPARDGGVRTTLWEFVCLTDDQNQPVEIQCMGVELTGRKQAERMIAAQRDLARLAALDKPEEEIWAACFQTAVLVSELDCGGLYLFNKSTHTFELVYHNGLGAEFVDAVTSFAEDTPSAQMVLKGENIYFTEEELQTRSYHRNEGLRSLAVIPILHREAVLGCVNIASHSYDRISDPMRDALETIAFEIGNVIAHYQTEAELESSHIQLRQTLMAARMGAWRYDIFANRIYWSPEAAQIIGTEYPTEYQEEDALKVLEHFFPSDREKMLHVLQDVLTQKKAWNFEYRLANTTGEMMWIASYGKVECDKEGNPTAISGLIQDITERKNMELALEAEAVRRRILFEEAPDGILIIDPETTRFVEFNTRAHTQLGYTREEFSKLSIVDVEVEETKEQTLAHIQDVIRNGKADFETLQRTKQGEIRNIHVTAQAVEIMGQPVYYCVWRDLTDRKRVEEARRESDERYYLLFHNMVQGVVFQDKGGRIIHANPAAEKILGLSMDQMLGRASIDPHWHAIHEDEAAFPGEDHPAMLALRTGQPVYDVVMGIFNPKNNSYRWVNINATPRFFNGNETPYQVFATFEDITERKQAELEIRKSEKRLRSMLEISQAMAASLEVDTVLQKIVENAVGLLGLESGAIYTLEGTELYLESATPPLPPAFPDELRRANIVDHPHIRAATSSGSIVTLADSMGVELSSAEKVAAEARRLRSILYIPLMLSEKAIGVLIVASVDRVRVFSSEEIDLYSGFSGQAAQTIENIRLYRSEREYAAELERQVAERKLAEENLRESERKYRDLINGMNDTVWVIDLDTHFLDVNEAAVRVMGYSREELLSMKISDVDAANKPEQIHQVIDRLRTEKLQVFETHHKTKDGRIIPVEVSSSLVSYMGKTVVMGIARDITERKQVLQELRASEENYRGLLESLDSVVATVDLNGKFLYMNDRAAEQLGGEPTRFIGKTMHELFPEQVAKKQLDDIHQVTETDQGNVFENLSFVNGQPRWYRTFIQPLHNEVGKVVSVLINSTDIHALKTMQQQLQELNRTLEEKVAQRTAEVQDLYENAPTGYHSVDANGTFIVVNQTKLNWLGYTREEMIGHAARDFMSAATLNIFEENLSLLMRRGWIKDVEFEFIRKDGSLMPVLLNATAIYDEDGNFVMSRSTTFDNTERKAAEEALRLSRDQLHTANKALQKASQAKNEFLANMSHELRTPLNGILGMSEVLMDEIRGPLNERQRTMLAVIESSGSHLLSLINDILDLSKIEAGKLELNFEEVPVMDVCQTSLTFIKEPAIKKGILVELELDPTVVVIRADLRRFKQILINLLSNAVKFTPSMGKITLRVAKDEEYQLIHFSVIDTGIGISDEDMKQLFTPFTQVDSSLTREHEGTGLGLALVMELVELHGGSVKVESVVGVGSTFTVSIPLYRASDKNTAKTEASYQEALVSGSISAQPQAQGKILVAEDIETNVMILTDYLESLGYTTIIASNGQEAVKRAEEHEPDLILMDIQMPIMDGLEATRRLRKNPRFASVPIIALTALAMTGDRERCLEAGANEYISKPVRLKQLAEMINHMLEHK